MGREPEGEGVMGGRVQWGPRESRLVPKIKASLLKVQSDAEKKNMANKDEKENIQQQV